MQHYQTLKILAFFSKGNNEVDRLIVATIEYHDIDSLKQNEFLIYSKEFVCDEFT